MKFLSFTMLFIFSFSCAPKHKESHDSDDKKKLELIVEELVVTSVLGGSINIELPKSFIQMGDQELSVKYSRSNSLPQEAYSNAVGTISLAFNHTSNILLPSDLPDFRQSFARQFKGTLGIHFIGSGMKKLNGRDFATLEFVSQAIDTKIYNLMFLTSFDDRLLICTFNCTESEMEKWKSTSQQIMNSIQVVE
jgi:hypothetical protein